MAQHQQQQQQQHHHHHNQNFNNFAYEVPPYFGGDQLVQGTPQYTAPYADMAPAGKKNVSIDVDQFIRTRDALSSAYMSLSSSIDKAVKAYIDHTNVVLAGDSSLNVSYLTQPFDQLANTAQLAQQALHAGGAAAQPAQPNGAALQPGEIGPDGKVVKRQKRAYKQRDPNAPKRPLTAYFRYLQEQRGPLAAQLAEKAGGTPQKPGDLSKEATERWNKLSKEEQQPYRDAYQRALKDYEKEVAAYKASGGKLDDGVAKVDGTAAEGADADVDEDDDDDDDDEDDSSDDSSEESSDESDEDEEEEAAPPPPPPPAKTPKSSKTSKAGGQVSSVETPVPAGSFSPNRKRKAVVETPVTGETGKKKRSKKTITAGEDAPVAQMTSYEPAKKEKGKRKRRKSEA